ncbi:MAG TPA: hypothetical protein PLO51_00435 [Candidatus Micrarchaeota archaeon]|nr:hypothetical protein [Candidatus Micrarchaeota archaeon]
MADYDIFISRLESGPLDRFKNQNLLLKKFGEEGLKVYNALEEPAQAKTLMESTGIKEAKFVSILEFMEENGIIAVSDKPPAGAGAAVQASAAEEEPEEEEPSAKKQPAKKQGKASQKKSSGGEEAGDGMLIKPVGIEPEEGEGEAPQEAEPAPEAREEQAAEESQGGEGEGVKDEIEDVGAGKGSEKAVQEEEKAESPEPEIKDVGEEEGQGREDMRGSIRGPEENRAAAEDEGKKQAEEEKLSKEDAAAREKLSPIERIIFNKYGSTGVLVYKLIDGEKTAEEIMLETGLSEVKLVEILEFLESQGIIKLEKPIASEAPAQAPSPGSGEPPPSSVSQTAGETPSQQAAPGQEEPEPSFRPMIEEKGDSIEAPPGTGMFPDIIPIDIPMPAPLNPISGASVNASLFLKFKGAGTQVYSMLDGKKDVIKIALESRRSLGEIDQVLALLGAKKAVYFKPMTKDEIKAAYGEDALSVYRKYGREGVLIYDLIGKEQSLRDIVLRSRVEPHHAVEILLFIHSILGVDMPLSREILYKQLGIS